MPRRARRCPASTCCSVSRLRELRHGAAAAAHAGRGAGRRAERRGAFPCRRPGPRKRGAPARRLCPRPKPPRPLHPPIHLSAHPPLHCRQSRQRGTRISYSGFDPEPHRVPRRVPRRKVEVQEAAPPPIPVAEAVKDANLEQLAARVVACAACGPVQGTPLRELKVVEQGAQPTRWLVVGEAPGEQGRPPRPAFRGTGPGNCWTPCWRRWVMSREARPTFSSPT